MKTSERCLSITRSQSSLALLRLLDDSARAFKELGQKATRFYYSDPCIRANNTSSHAIQRNVVIYLMTLLRTIATSDHWLARGTKGVLLSARSFSLPVPRAIGKVLLLTFICVRALYNWCFRVLIAETLFKAACRSYGRNLRTDVYVHWIQGRGDIVIGDDVLIDGKCSFTFAARYADRPTLVVGSGTGIGHACTFTVAKSISIGRNCRIAQGVWMFDSPGHPSDPRLRLANIPPSDAEIKPIRIDDNVWLGGRSVVFPGVTIGEGSIVAACAVVTSDIPAYSIVAGNPARRIGTLPRNGEGGK